MILSVIYLNFERRIVMVCKYKAVLFDFDGTFADTGRGVFSGVAYTVKKLGLEPLSQAALRAFIGPPLTDSFKLHLGLDEEEALSATDVFKEYYSAQGVYEFDVYDGITDIIENLRACGVKTGIASTKPKVFIEEILRKTGCDGYFDCISAPVSEERVEKSELIANALNALGIEKEKAVMIGDRHFDIEGAIGAEVDSIGVTYGYGSEDELKKAGAAHVAGSAEEIGNILFD